MGKKAFYFKKYIHTYSGISMQGKFMAPNSTVCSSSTRNSTLAATHLGPAYRATTAVQATSAARRPFLSHFLDRLLCRLDPNRCLPCRHTGKLASAAVMARGVGINAHDGPFFFETRSSQEAVTVIKWIDWLVHQEFYHIEPFIIITIGHT